MKLRCLLQCCWFGCVIAFAIGCKTKARTDLPSGSTSQLSPPFFKVDSAMAGSASGFVHFVGKRTARKAIDMSEDPACVEAHHGRASDESLVVSSTGALANAFIYIEKGLEGKRFEVPITPVTIDQRGCWFRPRVLGVQTGQVLQVVNSDPVTHNIHPLAEINREWNHSQGPGDAPLSRKFLKTEIMIPVKCNIHSWMHAFIGVVDHPYYAVSKDDGSFVIKDLPPGTYTIAVWEENLGTQKQQMRIAPGRDAVTHFTFRGE